LVPTRLQFQTERPLHMGPKSHSASLAAARYLFSANGASSLKAWGIAPGLGTESSKSAEGATQGIGMNRAFSAGIGIALIPGALPQAKMNTAPLALNRYMASAGMMILRRLRHVSQRKNRPPEETRGRFPR